MALSDILVFTMSAVIFRLVFGTLRVFLPGAGDRWRGWLLLVASILAVYWLQPPLPIRYIDFWLPTLTLLLVFLCWLVTAPREKRFARENLATIGLLVITILATGMTRYLSISGVITPSRPPEIWQVALLLVVVALLVGTLRVFLPGAGLLLRFPRSAATVPGITIFLLLFLFIILKLPALTLAASAGLRGLMGQSGSMANATDLRWLGFSYVAFRLIHTLRDRQTGRLPAVSLREYLVYVIFFPSFTAGPIDRLERFVKDLRQPMGLSSPGQLHPECSDEDFAVAGRRLLMGLFKKFALADGLALVALNAINAPQVQSTGWMWIVLYAYSLQIYLDFSGYTDIAIGLGRLLGIRLPENFNQPYLKPNLTQFWNNWHMTLTQWLRAYFFNPVTRSLRSARRPMPPMTVLFITQVSSMLLIGLWHGITWNFALWGLWHGIGIFAQNRWSDWIRPRVTGLDAHPWFKKGVAAAGTLLTFHYVTLGWVWFALPDLTLAGQVFQRLFGL